MEKTKKYKNVRLSPAHICDIKKSFMSLVISEDEKDIYMTLEAWLEHETWVHVDENEFFSDISKNCLEYNYRIHTLGGHSLTIYFHHVWHTLIRVASPTRSEIESVFQKIETLTPAAQIPERIKESNAHKIRVFIGHGRNPQWRDLKEHLQDKHGIDVQAYETGERAGHTIRDVLEEMLDESSIAFLVLTGEDETSEGGLRARQNVIHEVGLFQGHLGFPRAIVLLEDGVELFSNLDGVQQIRFGKGRIREVFGDTLAVIRREFGVENLGKR
jgi:predicted nucleotide-binding protein